MMCPRITGISQFNYRCGNRHCEQLKNIILRKIKKREEERAEQIHQIVKRLEQGLDNEWQQIGEH